MPQRTVASGPPAAAPPTATGRLRPRLRVDIHSRSDDYEACLARGAESQHVRLVPPEPLDVTFGALVTAGLIFVCAGVARSYARDIKRPLRRLEVALLVVLSTPFAAGLGGFVGEVMAGALARDCTDGGLPVGFPDGGPLSWQDVKQLEDWCEADNRERSTSFTLGLALTFALAAGWGAYRGVHDRRQQRDAASGEGEEGTGPSPPLTPG